MKAYTNAYILDGTENMKPYKGSVVVDGSIIKAVIPEGGELPEGCGTVDLSGRYIMPGLINLHLHLPATGKPQKKQQDNAKKVRLLTSNALFRYIVYKMGEKSARTQLLSGVTTIRTMGGVLDMDTRLRNNINSGRTLGPRVLACDMAVSVPGGHMAGSLAYMATSAEEAAGYVRKICEAKPDLIKLMITGGVLDAKKKGEPGELKMPFDYVKAACDEAHAHGLKVAAHVESPEGVRVALEGGVDTIEHGAEPDDEIIRLFKEKGAVHVATLSPALPYALFDRAISNVSETEKYNGEIVFKGIIDCAKACIKAGVPVGLGTDTGCPYITHYDMWREVNYYKKYCGVSAAMALSTATLINARIAGIDDVTGSIETGKEADLLITSADPLKDLTVLREPYMVVARGREITDLRIKKMKNVEKELDKFV